ncbi:hypothetical protein B0W47_14580 [Komagataeibacter nataicola]|uniref:Uncharacterized protein n=1 Tax=Komagataeibacter nataicola TaxID=265960 RepID=A0A9N7CAL2_9PROT|nr:hypothetical protein B0W47_14580 [Komagataeibacter nataicola]PYD67177.1 hypothetical protein CDI09_04385 [Komagataeibacter nataicola]
MGNTRAEYRYFLTFIIKRNVPAFMHLFPSISRTEGKEYQKSDWRTDYVGYILVFIRVDPFKNADKI